MGAEDAARSGTLTNGGRKSLRILAFPPQIGPQKTKTCAFLLGKRTVTGDEGVLQATRNDSCGEALNVVVCRRAGAQSCAQGQNVCPGIDRFAVSARTRGEGCACQGR